MSPCAHLLKFWFRVEGRSGPVEQLQAQKAIDKVVSTGVKTLRRSAGTGTRHQPSSIPWIGNISG